MKRILGVVRASTEHQEIVSQKAELSSYIVSLGYSDNEIEWIEVAGASARKANKKYLDMLQSIKDAITNNSTIKACAFWHLNRLGRIDTYIISMKNWFIDNNIQVYVKNPSLTLLNEDGSINAGAEIAWGVFATMVKQETSEMFEKVKRGKERNAQQGLFNGGNIQIGYKLNPVTKKLEIDHEEVELLRLIFTEYCDSRLSTYYLATELQERGITQRGKKITAQWLQRILASESFKDLVGEALFNRAQDIIASRTVRRKSKKLHICGGLIKCPVCGGNMFADTKGYKCYNHYNQYRRDGATPCANTAKINATVIDNLAFEIATIGYADFMAINNREAVEEYKKEAAVNRQKIEEAKRKLEKLDGKRNRIKTLFINGDIDESEYSTMKHSTVIEYNHTSETINYLTVLNSELDAKIEALENTEEFERVVEALDGAENFTVEQAKDLVRKFIKEITFFKDEGARFHIAITAINGGIWEFKYYPYAKDGRVLRSVNSEGRIGRFLLKKRFENGRVVRGEAQYISEL